MEQNLDLIKQKVFDEICGIVYVNIFTKTKNSEVITISPFDVNNKEHLFVLSVAKGLGSVEHKKIVVDVGRWNLRKLNRGVDKECRYMRLAGEKPYHYLNPDELLEFMREWAIDLCKVNNIVDFNFGNIYDAFYSKKEDEQ